MFIFETPEQRQSAAGKINVALLAPTGTGKTYQARFLDPKTTLFLDLEGGTLALGDWPGKVLKVRDVAAKMQAHPWEIAKALVCWIGGPDPSDKTGAYSQQSYAAYVQAFGDPAAYAHIETVYLDSITVLSRWCFDWCKTQPQAFSEKTGKPDTRGAYGLLGQEMVKWLTQAQHIASKSVIVVGILNVEVDDLNRKSYSPQIEGGKTKDELPGIFDEVISYLSDLEFADGSKHRAFVCQQQNPWGLPAKDRSGTLNMVEPPNIAQLLQKIRAGRRLDADPGAASAMPAVPAGDTAGTTANSAQ